MTTLLTFDRCSFAGETIRKDFANKLRAEPGERSVVARISTTSVDRDGDVLLPSGVLLSDFRKNPVVLFAHSHGTFPIGRAESIRQETDGITAKVKFADRPSTHPAAVEWLPDTVLALMQQDVLRGFSVGFTIEDARDPTPRDIGKFGEDLRRVIAKWKLIEFSVVPIPANQDALAVEVSKGLKTRAAGLWGIKEKRKLMLDLLIKPKLSLCDTEPRRVLAVDN